MEGSLQGLLRRRLERPGLPTAYGGQGLPEAIGIAVKEMASSANLSFSLGPLLTTGAALRC
jgi:alkylation response protein AidB-like acyl-CoA dehydrogenase